MKALAQRSVDAQRHQIDELYADAGAGRAVFRLKEALGVTVVCS